MKGINIKYRVLAFVILVTLQVKYCYAKITKTEELSSLVENLQNKNQQKNLNPKLAATQLLETIDKFYVTMPPGSITKDMQGTLWFLKGQSYTTLQQYEKAIKSFDQSIKYDPNNLSALLMLLLIKAIAYLGYSNIKKP